MEMSESVKTTGNVIKLVSQIPQTITAGLRFLLAPPGGGKLADGDDF